MGNMRKDRQLKLVGSAFHAVSIETINDAFQNVASEFEDGLGKLVYRSNDLGPVLTEVWLEKMKVLYKSWLDKCLVFVRTIGSKPHFANA